MMLIITTMFYNAYCAIVLQILLTAKSISNAVEKVMLGVSSYSTPVVCWVIESVGTFPSGLRHFHKKVWIDNKLSQLSYYRPTECSNSLDYCLQKLKDINKINIVHKNLRNNDRVLLSEWVSEKN